MNFISHHLFRVIDLLGKSYHNKTMSNRKNSANSSVTQLVSDILQAIQKTGRKQNGNEVI